MNELELAECRRLIEWGLAEDLGVPGDLTTNAIIDADAVGAASIVVRQPGVVAGFEVLELLAQAKGLRVESTRGDGPVDQDTPIASLSGHLRELLAVERLALNFLARLSGIATLTARFVHAVEGTRAKICDTRKTTPGWRHLEKYAVRIGGGTNHRAGLYDAVLIKDNHLASLQGRHESPIRFAVERARAVAPAGTIVQIEVDSLAQFEEALASEPDMVLLDNMSAENVGLAVEIRDMKVSNVLLEATGGITLENVAEIARSGVERISIGALTHSAPALDLGLDYAAASSSI